MTSEEQQNDMSMEDILSSIKDILESDSPTMPQEPAAPNTVENSQPVSEISEEDDVFDLSKSMIIEENANTSALDLDEVGPDFDIPAINEDKPLFDETDNDFPNLEIENIEEQADVAQNISSEIPEEVEQSVTEDFSFNIDDILKSASETIEADSQGENMVAPEVVIEPEEIEVAPENSNQASIDVVSEPILDEEVAQPVEYETSIPDSENVIDSNVTPVMTSPEETITTDSTAQKQENVDAADVSAGIINNFAKMFAEKTQEQAQEPVRNDLPNISGGDYIGNGSKTIEDVVKDVIREIIASKVNEEMVESSEIMSYAQAEIKAWIENHLPSIVEAAVQKEIERVMAKVGK